jgi:hypothetical protein
MTNSGNGMTPDLPRCANFVSIMITRAENNPKSNEEPR